MKRRVYQSLFWLMVMLVGFRGTADATLSKGATAPAFAGLPKKQMGVLYFYKTGAPASEKGLEDLAVLYQQYPKEGIEIIGIHQGKAGAGDASGVKPPPFSIVRDDGKLFEQYQVQVLLPTTYILAPGGRIADVIEGRGTGLIASVAHHALHLKKPPITEEIFNVGLARDPQDKMARADHAEALRKRGKTEQAEAEFVQLASEAVILGKTGLADIYRAKGEHEKAMTAAEAVQKQDPKSGLVHLLRGNVLARQGKYQDAQVSLRKALDGSLSDPHQAEAANQLGRIYSDQGDYSTAEKLYREAMARNPFSAEILANQAVILEKRGETQAAKNLYQDALVADPDDEIVKHLAKRMEQNLAFQEDMERQKRVSALVSELVERASKEASAPTQTDAWSSRPMTVALLGIDARGVLREGMTEALQQAIGQAMMAGGRIAVVEREVMDHLLSELQLATSALADPSAALRLGKILAARLIVTGTLTQMPEGMRLGLRVVDPETSEIKISHNDALQENLTAFAERTAETLGRQIRRRYPLQGKIASVETSGTVVVNLGRRHGIVSGDRLSVIEEGEPILSEGRTLGHKKNTVASLTITDVEENLAYGKMADTKTVIAPGQKVMEAQDAL